MRRACTDSTDHSTNVTCIPCGGSVMPRGKAQCTLMCLIKPYILIYEYQPDVLMFQPCTGGAGGEDCSDPHFNHLASSVALSPFGIGERT